MRKKYYCFLTIMLVGIVLCACDQTMDKTSDIDVQLNETEVQTSDDMELHDEGSTDEVTYEQISMEEAKRLMTEEVGYIIVDVRTLEEYAGGHIPNAICIPNESIGDEMPEKLPNKEQLILVYCRSGNRSKQASQKLTKLDYTNVKEFGGIMDWDGDIEQ